ncbi:MAG: sortase [Ardenticatenia bacterium]|nr:sortase [Ardenticatenia bacterium]
MVNLLKGETMRYKRSVDDLSLEELERLVLLKRREERQRRLRRKSTTFAEVPPPPPPDVRRHDDLAFMGRARRKRARWARGLRRNAPWQDRVLFLVEMLALVGLVITLVLFMAEREELNAESLRAMASAVEETDPGSHTSTQALPRVLPGRPPPPADTQPIYPALYADRIVPSTVQNPEPLLDEVEAQRLPARIRIPKINVDAPIVLGDDWESLKKGVGWYLASAKPGERGNIVLSRPTMTSTAKSSATSTSWRKAMKSSSTIGPAASTATWWP